MSTKRPVRAIDHYDNGQIRFRGANLDGKMHGPWKFFRRDGSLMRSGQRAVFSAIRVHRSTRGSR